MQAAQEPLFDAYPQVCPDSVHPCPGFAMARGKGLLRTQKENRQEAHFPAGSRYIGIRSYICVCSAASDGAGFAIAGRCRIIAVIDIAAQPNANDRWFWIISRINATDPKTRNAAMLRRRLGLTFSNVENVMYTAARRNTTQL